MLPSFQAPETSRPITKRELGDEMVKVTFGSRGTIFSIHKNLICMFSPWFNRAMNDKRQPVEGKCMICYEHLNPTDQAITFCRGGCGINFHVECMKTWKSANNAMNADTTCPHCRRIWPAGNVISSPTSSRAGFRLYVHWLYHETIPLKVKDDEPIAEQHNRQEITLVIAFVTSVILEDNLFQDAVLKAFVELFQKVDCDIRTLSPPAINSVYSLTTAGSRIRQFFVKLFMITENQKGRRKYRKKKFEPLCAQFQADLDAAYETEQGNENELSQEDRVEALTALKGGFSHLQGPDKKDSLASSFDTTLTLIWHLHAK